MALPFCGSISLPLFALPNPPTGAPKEAPLVAPAVINISLLPAKLELLPGTMVLELSAPLRVPVPVGK